MKIISKTYLLIGVLIIVAVFNLLILYNAQVSVVSESYSIIRAGDLKAKVETIAALASSIASGNDSDRKILEAEVMEFDAVLNTLRNGGQIRGQSVSPIPADLMLRSEALRKS